MNGGGGSNFPPPQPNGGDYLLSLLQKPRPNPHSSQSSTPQQSPIIDPAVAKMGPTIPTNGHDHPNHHPHHHHQHHLHQHQHPHLPPWSHTPSPHVFGLTHNPFPLQRVPETPYSNFTNANSASLTEGLRRLGFPIQSSNNNNSFIQQQQQHQHQQQELKLQFGSLPTVSYAAATSHDGSTNGFVDRNKIEKRGVIGEQIRVPPPPGFGNKDELGGGKNVRGNVGHELKLPDQLDHPGPPSGSNLRSGYDDVDAVGEQLADSLLLEDEIEEKSGNSIKRRGPKEKVNA